MLGKGNQSMFSSGVKKMGISIVMVVPLNVWFIREKPIRMDDLRVSLF